MTNDVLECGFCNVNQGGDVTEVLGDSLVAFVQSPNEQGALNGSGVIIRRRHAETVFDLSAEEVAATFELLGLVKSRLDAEHRPDGYNVGWNCYEVAGQHLPLHAHMHVIPRFRQEPFAGRGIRYWLKQPENAW